MKTKTLKKQLVTAILLLGFLFLGNFVKAQNELPLNSFSDWLFVKSDKAVQIRYKMVKKQTDVGDFQVQFRIAFEDAIHCSKPNCLGYMMVFGIPTIDGQKIENHHYKLMNTFVDVYNYPETIKIKLSFPDGSKRFLTNKGFFYTTTVNPTPEPNSYLFSNCVDNIISNYPYNNCRDFEENKAITLK